MFQRLCAGLGGGHLGRRGGKGGGDQQGLAGDARALSLSAVELVFQALVDDAFVRGVHVHHHQALLVFGEDIDTVQLRHSSAERPGVVGGIRVVRALIAVGGRSHKG